MSQTSQTNKNNAGSGFSLPEEFSTLMGDTPSLSGGEMMSASSGKAGESSQDGGGMNPPSTPSNSMSTSSGGSKKPPKKPGKKSFFDFFKKINFSFLKHIKPKYYAIGLTLLVALIAGAYFINMYLTGTRAGTNDILLNVTAPKTAQAGQKINVGVIMSNKDHFITGADICLTYDQNVLTYVPQPDNIIQTPDHFNIKILDTANDEKCPNGARVSVVADKKEEEMTAHAVTLYFPFNVTSTEETTVGLHTTNSQFTGTLSENNGIFSISEKTQNPQAILNKGGSATPSPTVTPPQCTKEDDENNDEDVQQKEYVYYHPRYVKNYELGDGVKTEWSFPVLTNISANTAQVELTIYNGNSEGTLNVLSQTINPKTQLNFYGLQTEWFTNTANNINASAIGWYKVVSNRPLAAYNRTLIIEGQYPLHEDTELLFFQDEPLYMKGSTTYYSSLFTKGQPMMNPEHLQFSDLSIANISDNQANITLIMRDYSGNEIGTTGITISPKGMWDSWNQNSEWRTIFSQTGGAYGSIELRSDTSVIPLHRTRVVEAEDNNYPDGHAYSFDIAKNPYFNNVVMLEEEKMVSAEEADTSIRSSLWQMGNFNDEKENVWQWSHPVILNTTSSQANITLNVYKWTGGLHASLTKTLGAHSVYNSYGDSEWAPQTNENSGGIPTIDAEAKGPNESWGVGYVEVVSDQKIIGMNRVTFREQQGEVETYLDPVVAPLLDDEPFISTARRSKKIYIPQYLRNWPSYGQNQYTNMVITNPDDTQTAMNFKIWHADTGVVDAGKVLKEFNRVSIPARGDYNGHADPEWYNNIEKTIINGFDVGDATDGWVEVDADTQVFGFNRVSMRSSEGNPFSEIEIYNDGEDLAFYAEEIGACVEDTDCESGYQCKDGECKKQGSGGGNECPSGMTCGDDGFCLCPDGTEWCNGQCVEQGTCDDGNQYEEEDNDTDDDGIEDDQDLDDDNDGIRDTEEGDGSRDTDGDGIPDSRDIDSDDDGITDFIEAKESPIGRPFNSLIPDECMDSDGDGLMDIFQGGVSALDTDGDGTPDYIDTDADGDGVKDAIEGHDANSDGIADTTGGTTDNDKDGLKDGYDVYNMADAAVCGQWLPNITGTNAPLQDTDGDSIEDWRDPDDDNDGVQTKNEDTNNDGNWSNDDADNDGIPAYLDPDEKGGGGGQCEIGAVCGTNKVYDANCICVCGPGYVDCNGDGECELPTDPVCDGNVSVIKSIKVKFQGVIPVGGRRPSEDPLNSEVSIVGGDYNHTTRADFYAYTTVKDEAGNDVWLWEAKDVPFPQIIAGDKYKVYIKGPKHLQKKICDNNPTESRDGGYVCSDANITINSSTQELDFTNIYLLAGDIPFGGGKTSQNADSTLGGQDRIVDSVDITYLRAALKRSQDERKEIQLNRIGDLSLDAIVDAQDYQLAIYSLGFKYDDQLLDDIDD